jgi:hypothetical protein
MSADEAAGASDQDRSLAVIRIGIYHHEPPLKGLFPDRQKMGWLFVKTPASLCGFSDN